MTSLFILAITLEPIRYLMAFFMMSSHNKPRHNKPPRVCDLLLDNISPVIAVLQYFSTLLRRGAPGRLRLIWGREGDTSLAAWARRLPEKARLLRRMLLSGGAWVYKGHLIKINKFPWTLAKLIDPRVAWEAKEKLVVDWAGKDLCCVPPGVARWLRGRVVDPMDLLHCRTWQRMIHMWAKFITFSIADVERLHAGNRARKCKMYSKNVMEECCCFA